MDALAEEGVVILGGPVGEGDGEDTLLADDPWGTEMLTIVSVEPWSVWLRATT
jgi:hypothetical protein